MIIMKNAWKSSHGWFPAALTGFLMAGVCLADNDVVVRTYRTPQGEVIGSASLSLQGQSAPVREAVDHVILLDTSASQVGEHRQMGLEAVQSFLQSLPQSDRVLVLAYDVHTAPLTKGWSAPDVAQSQIQSALSTRFPAGAADLSVALTMALDQFGQNQLGEGRQGSVLIIGDGMSAAHLFQPSELQSLTDQFRDREIPIHAFALGSKTDLRLLGALAQETGGFVMQDEWSKNSLSPQAAGQLLADASHVPVFYPEKVEIAANGVSLVPNRPLPMRADRETVYLLEGPVSAGSRIDVTGQFGGQPIQASWKLPEPTRTMGNTFLVSYLSDAKATNGIAMGLAGDWMVNAAHQSFEDNTAELGRQGHQALKAGLNKEAERIGTLLEKIDPQNPQGNSLIQQAMKQEMQLAQAANLPAGPAPQSSSPDAIPAPPTATAVPEGAPSDGTPVPPAPSPFLDREQPLAGGNIQNYEALVQAKGQKLARQVEQQIDQAYQMLENAQGPAAEELLNRTRVTIKTASDIPAELRNSLLRRVNSILDDVIARQAQYAAIAQERQRLRAEQEVTARLIDFATARDKKMEQMVDRIRALMVDAYHGDPNAFEAAEMQAREVLSEYPGSAIGVAEVFVTEAAGQVDKAARLRALRSDRLLETLHQVELAHVPFPDEPPIRYPPAEVWWALTEMRQKWKSVDLRLNSKNEEKIYHALEQVTSVEFPANPLRDVVEFISQQHGIPIILDRPALEAEGLTGDEEIMLVLSGIKLKSALKLMLENVGGTPLTYVIEDEVMKITTQTDADEKLQTRVYPVADLVIPVMPLGGGMGMMGGMGGGMGGGMMGGGMGGMGGGMGGMGGMGGGMGGMGMFSIPPEPLPAAAPAASPESIDLPLDQLKKKPTP
jgi:hypothetical protein